MPIYFLQCESTKLIKIGCVKELFNLKARLNAHRCQVSTRLTFLGILPDLHQDTIIHRQFKPLRHHAEWFIPGDDLLLFIKEKAVIPIVLAKKCQQAVARRGKPCGANALPGESYCKIHNSETFRIARMVAAGELIEGIAADLQRGDTLIYKGRPFEIVSEIIDFKQSRRFKVRYMSEGEEVEWKTRRAARVVVVNKNKEQSQ